MPNKLSLHFSLFTVFFWKSFNEGELLHNWKDAILTRLHKKGEKEFARNYRPINLTFIVSKVIESIITNDILAYMLNNNLLTNLHHEFVPGKSCQFN